MTQVSTEKGTGETGEGNTKYHYAKITVPALTAGELMVSDNGEGPSDAYLCRGSTKVAESRANYTNHNNAEKEAVSATNAATEARADADKPGASVRTLKSDLRTAANRLGYAADDLRKFDTSTADDNADTAELAEMAADAVADRADADVDALQTALRTAADTLDAAADDLREAATVNHMDVMISVLISSGDEEYVVVVSATEAPVLSIAFEGVMSTDAAAEDGGSFTQNNQRITHTLKTTDDTPGLLTVKTTGSAVDTIGTLDGDNDATNGDIAMDEGSGGNFEIVSPVKANNAPGAPSDYKIHVDGQTRGERGDYGLKVEFGVADPLTLPTSDNTPTPVDRMLEPRRSDYLFFTADNHRFLTVQTQKHRDVTTETNTTGTLYGQAGQITTDTNSGTGNNFLFRTPISLGDYIVEVKGASSSTEGQYVLTMTSTPAPSQGSAPDGIMTSTDNTEITNPAEVDPHSITVTKAGTLQVKTTGTAIDTVGVLYGPDGRQIATDDDSGDGMNFLITEYVEAGQYIVTVEGQTRTATGAYTLVVNFVEGATIDGGPTTPGTGDVARLQQQVRDLQEDLAECQGDTVTTHAKGVLGNPSGGGFRSGIGLISGWVCAASDVEVRIYNSRDRLVRTLDVAYGTSRPDTVGQCRHNSPDTGFGMTYNFNHLPEGQYTIRAYADGTDNQIDEPQTFEVVHLTEFEATDDDRFLRLPADVQARGECIVNDFPAAGEDTYLKWEQSIQNFVIEDAG